MSPTATSGILPVNNLKSLANWRAFIHQVVMVAVPVLVAMNLVKESDAVAALPFVLAIFDSVLSAENATDKARKVVYAVIGLLQSGGLLVRLLTEFAPDYVTIGGAVLAVVSAFLARFYTPTTTVVTLPPAEVPYERDMPSLPPTTRRRLP